MEEQQPEQEKPTRLTPEQVEAIESFKLRLHPVIWLIALAFIVTIVGAPIGIAILVYYKRQNDRIMHEILLRIQQKGWIQQDQAAGDSFTESLALSYDDFSMGPSPWDETNH